MSLTSLIRSSEVKELLKNYFPKTPALPRSMAGENIKVLPLSNRYVLIGTAFDYLLRFYLERLNKNVKLVVNKWVAEYVPHIPLQRSLLKKAKEIISEAKANHAEYLASGHMTKNLIISSLQLAQLDFIYRAGQVSDNLGHFYEEDIEELQKLMRVVPADLFRASQLCVLNPTFGHASLLVGGADADLLIDDTLIDIKTTIHLKISRYEFNQLVGYYALYKIAGIDGTDSDVEIKKAGIYFSRYGLLYTFKIKDFISDDKVIEFANFLVRRKK